MKRHLKLGTRGSLLARAQSQWVANQVQVRTGHSVELVIIETKGDRITDRPLNQVGGKGLFTKEVEDALLDHSVDFAVHSMKDMPTDMPEGLMLGCIPEREDPRDSLVGCSLAALVDGTVVGTGSARRQSMLHDMHPGVSVKGIRGNVDTRIQKMRRGEYDAVVLAAAGIKRLGRGEEIDDYFPIEHMVPAVGQGALAVQCRSDDTEVQLLLGQLACVVTTRCVSVERAFLAKLGGGCSVPAACHAILEGEGIRIYAAYQQSSGEVQRLTRFTSEGDEIDVAAGMAELFLAG